MLYVAVFWMRRDYTPRMGLKREFQNVCMMAGTRSQDGGRSHSKREKSVHGSQIDNRAAACKTF